MESHERVKTFAHRFFRIIWENLEDFAPDDKVRNSHNAYQTGTDFEEYLDECILCGTITSLWFYEYTFINNADNKKFKYWKSKQELLNYVRRNCNCENWFGKPSIFERFFASLCFVLVCTNDGKKISNSLKRYAPACWEEYFSEYIEEFYSKGGWDELERLINSHEQVNTFINMIFGSPPPELHSRISKSVENYLYFIAIRNSKIVSALFKSLKIEDGNKCKTVTSLWIKFIVQNGNVQSFNNSCTQPPKNPSEATCLLRALRYLCDYSELAVRDFDSSLADILAQISDEQVICSSEQIQESCTRKKKKGQKEKLQHSDKLNPSEAMGQACSSSINNRSLRKTAVEKNHEDKDASILNFTACENDVKRNISIKRIKDTNISGAKTPAVEINDNNWSIQKKGETEDEYFHRLERFILSSNESTSTKESHGKRKTNSKKKNSGISTKKNKL